MICKNDLWGFAAVAVMVCAPCLIEARPAATEAVPAAYITEDKPACQEELPENSAEELYSSDTNPVCDGIPLDYELAHVLVESCLEENVPLELALAVMEQESGFRTDVVSPSGCYGLMQLNPSFFPVGLRPAENVEAGVGYLGDLLELYDGDQARAATAYYYGPSDRESSWYSREVLERAEKWK